MPLTHTHAYLQVERQIVGLFALCWILHRESLSMFLATVGLVDIFCTDIRSYSCSDTNKQQSLRAARHTKAVCLRKGWLPYMNEPHMNLPGLAADHVAAMFVQARQWRKFYQHFQNFVKEKHVCNV